jgi:hypothetical protein
MPNLLVQVPRQATASYMPAPEGVTRAGLVVSPLVALYCSTERAGYMHARCCLGNGREPEMSA